MENDKTYLVVWWQKDYEGEETKRIHRCDSREEMEQTFSNLIADPIDPSKIAIYEARELEIIVKVGE